MNQTLISPPSTKQKATAVGISCLGCLIPGAMIGLTVSIIVLFVVIMLRFLHVIQ